MRSPCFRPLPVLPALPALPVLPVLPVLPEPLCTGNECRGRDAFAEEPRSKIGASFSPSLLRNCNRGHPVHSIPLPGGQSCL
ncbi:hypothetical protein P154DRAFT_528222 [Amniculicola lignicola CBS 123094]|uniref:Uncharacterized protein n=1 Tax=Amniculicola lignicola CBS 123094 TaxID=1392246 RepID=A0A6A5VVR7_9PLEO|nr:hypothetical protein P154DRAFT_528222 [Amniculicola lignicola CBS 123094]